MDENDEEAIEAVHGLVNVARWTGSEVMHRTLFPVPAVVAAYNCYMNSVDRMDQIQASAPTKR